MVITWGAGRRRARTGLIFCGAFEMMNIGEPGETMTYDGVYDRNELSEVMLSDMGRIRWAWCWTKAEPIF